MSTLRTSLSLLSIRPKRYIIASSAGYLAAAGEAIIHVPDAAKAWRFVDLDVCRQKAREIAALTNEELTIAEFRP